MMRKENKIIWYLVYEEENDEGYHIPKVKEFKAIYRCKEEAAKLIMKPNVNKVQIRGFAS